MRSTRIHTFGTPMVTTLEQTESSLPGPSQVRVKFEVTQVIANHKL